MAGLIVDVLAIAGLVIGLVVLGVVNFLLANTLAPLTKILSDLRSAKTAPMLERGVPGTEQLGTTRRLAESVPDLAMAYLQKLSLAPRAEAPAPPPAAAAPPPMPAAAPAPQAPAPQAPAPSGPATPGLPTQLDDPRLPAWKRYRG
jgi:hypothetical protein